MSTGGQARMAAAGPAARPPTRPSRLPLHRPRPSTDQSSPASPALSPPICRTEASHTSPFGDASNRRVQISGSRPAQVRLNRMSLQDPQGVTDELPSRRRSQPQPQSRPRDATGVNVGVAATAQNNLANGGVINDMRHAGRLADKDPPSCGVRMTALRSASREQQPSPTSSAKSSSTASDRHATATRLRYDAAARTRPVAEPRDPALSHRASNSSIDSTCSDHPQRRAPVVPRRPTTSSRATDDSGNRQHSGIARNSSASHSRQTSEPSRAIVLSDCDEITSSRSECPGPPVLRRLPAADQQTDKLQRRPDSYRSTSDVFRPTDILRGFEHRQRSAIAIVEPQRRYCHQWRLSETDVDDISLAGSMSTITSVASSCSSSSKSPSSGTLTDDADESTDESTSTAGRDRQLRDRHQRLDASGISSAALAFNMHQGKLPLNKVSIASGHKARTKLHHSGCTGRASSSELPSPPSATAIVGSRRPAANYSEDTRQRIGNFGVTSHVPVASGKHITTSPSASPHKSRSAAIRPQDRPALASATDELVTGSRSNVSSSHGRFPAESSPVWNPRPVKTPNSPAHAHVQPRQIAAVKKAAAAAGVSNCKSPVNHFPGSSPSNISVQSPLQRASGDANVRAASKISSAFRDTRRTGSITGLHTNVVDKDSTNTSNGRELVDKSAGNTRMGIIAPQGGKKPFTTATVKQVGTSQKETAHNMVNSHPAKTAREIPTPSTRTVKTQTPLMAATRRNDPLIAVTKRPPPPPPSKMKKPGFASDRRCVSGNNQRRAVSMDCSMVSPVRQQTTDVRCKKSDSCTNVANLSTSVDQAMMMRKPAKGVLNKNAELAKSYDCITSFSGDSERQKSDVICSQLHGSSISLVDVPPHKLVKPYSVINRCSTFGRKMTQLKVLHSTTAACNAQTETENVAARSRSSLTSQTRASELSDLPEVDEFECDCQMSAISRLSTADEGDAGSDGGQLQSPVETAATIESPSIRPSIQQKSNERHKYRTEYLAFLSAFPPKDDKLLAVEVASTNISSPHQDCISAAIKPDRNHTEDSSCSFKTRHPESYNRQTSQYSTHKVEGVQLNVHVESDVKSCTWAARPVMLSGEIQAVEDVAGEAADTPSSADNYVVTYESDNIVVLDREPVIDCLTPDGDVVSTEVCQMLTAPVDCRVGTTSGEAGGLSRTLPLSESGYDTWKSSQGSVAVAGSTCIVAPDLRADQHQNHEIDGTLRGGECRHLTALDIQSAQIVLENNADTTEEREIRRPEESGDSWALFAGADDLCGESVTGAPAADEVTDNKKRSESRSLLDDDSGRVADASVEDSALGDAQMFDSICSDAVAGAASFPSMSCSAASRGSGPSPSPPDNALSGLVGPIDICSSSQTIPSNDSDILPASCSSSRNAAHLERFDDEAHNASSLLAGVGRFRHHVDEQIHVSGASENSTDVVYDDMRSDPAVISTRKMADDFDAGADVKQSDEHRGFVGKASIESSVPDEINDAATRPSSTAVAAAVSYSTSLDPYETICDDLLESAEANSSDSETSQPSFSTCQPAVPCSTDVVDRRPCLSSEQSEKLAPANDDNAITVAVSGSSVDLQSAHNSVSALNSGAPQSSGGPPLTTAVTGRLPAMTLRRARTNFSVVYRHTTSQPTSSQSQQSSAHGEHVETAKAVTQQRPPQRVDQQPGAVGCRRALAVLASRLDDRGRRRPAEKNVDKPKLLSQSAAVDHDPAVAADSPAVSLSSTVKPVATCSTVTRHNDATAASLSVPCDLQSTQSQVNAHDGASVRAESKLPVSVTTSAQSFAPKKPSTFRRLLSAKLTNVVRRTQTNKTRTSSLS